LIIVSNRAPSVSSSGDAGGLVVALKGTLEKQGGLWIGANPETVQQPKVGLTYHKRPDFDIAHFEMSQADHDDYYLGYANSVLWPIFHGRVDLLELKHGFADAYWRVNARIAHSMAEMLEPDDLIWVQDYQLIPLARQFRKMGLKNAIGFFLHIPVPDVQTFKAIPEWRKLARGLCDYDLVGLQAKRDVANFIDIAQHAVGGELISNGNILVNSREVRIGSFPISIDTRAFKQTAMEAEDSLSPCTISRIIGVDRLDYSKGLPQRFESYERFLEKHPEWHKRVQFLQVAPPTRSGVDAYDDIRRELEQAAGRINGNFGDVDWTPIQYIHRPLPRDQLAGLYRQSRVGMVTPLFDGMNLVAKEYVAAQNEENPGVLILSQFAGAAEELTSALLINPHDIDDGADAIHEALEMDLARRLRYHTASYDHIAKNDIASWTEAYLKRLSGSDAHKAAMGISSQTRMENLRNSMAQALDETRGGDIDKNRNDADENRASASVVSLADIKKRG
jgi:trehalose 6-phosphate synthase